MHFRSVWPKEKIGHSDCQVVAMCDGGVVRRHELGPIVQLRCTSCLCWLQTEKRFIQLTFCTLLSESKLPNFYRAMHFSAKRGIAIACRLSLCPSVCLSVTLVDCDHIRWNSSKIISPLVSLGCSLFATPTWRVCSRGNTPKFGPKVTHPLLIWASETFDRKLRLNGDR